MLRSVIQTQDQLDALVTSLRDTLTLGNCAHLIDKHIKDPAIQADLDRVVGKKGGTPLKHRLAHELAAQMLEFESVHVMAAHYKQMPSNLYNVVTMDYHNHIANDTFRFLTQGDPHNVGFLRLIGPLGIDFEPNLESEELFLDVNAGQLPPDKVLHTDLIIDGFIGTCHINAEDIQAKYGVANESNLPMLMHSLAILRAELDVRGFWGDEWEFGEPCFQSIEREGGPTREKFLSLTSGTEAPAPENDFELCTDRGIFIEYNKETGDLVRVVLFSN